MPTRPPVFRPNGRSRKDRNAAAKRNIDKRRGSSTQRGYGADWQRLRAVQLQREPLCAMCLERGRFTPAAVVDHIVPIAQAPELRLNLANLRSLCKRCHDAHTARTQGFASGRKEGVDKKSDGSKP